MGTILDRIIEQKKQEVRELRQSNQVFGSSYKRKSFINKLEHTSHLSIIAEYKRASPSKGMINNEIEPGVQADAYEKFGASAISVLTDKTFFQGSFDDLRAVRKVVDLPILCKDFMIDPLQIEQAAVYGSDIILLIVAALEDSQLAELFQYSKQLGLEALVEVHNESELEKALAIGAKLIGVNNRDLKTFQVSLEVTEKLAASVKKSGAFLISESGIHHQNDVSRVRNAGANAILVGESFMKSTNIQQTFLDFRLPLAEGASQ